MRAILLSLAALVGLFVACGDDDLDVTADAAADAPDRCAYPLGRYGVGTADTLPDLALESDTGPVRLSELRGCGDDARLWVLRVVTASCGGCLWAAAHTAEIQLPGVRVIDVVVRGREGALPTVDDLAWWRAQGGAQETLLDPGMHFAETDPGFFLPLVLLIDAARMRVLTTQSNPDGDYLVERIERELLRLDGKPLPPAREYPLHDGLFTRTEWDLVREMALPEDFAPPPDPTDRHADDPRAAALGARLFDDAEFSPNGVTACRSCHDPVRAFSDGLPTAHGVGVGDRNAPTVLFAAHQRWQFWDGRADTLWVQALGPFENELEIGTTRLAVVHRIAAQYRAEFEVVYGALPPLEQSARFPAHGKPGDPAWEAMAPADRDAVTRAFASVGKAIAAFERTLRVADNPLDRYARGDTTALTMDQKLGLRSFLGAGCVQCHYGPRLTDDAFHVVRFGTGRRDGAADRGRLDGISLYAASEFSASSVYSDAPLPRPEALALVGQSLLQGQFKTPTLRGVAVSAPFGHGGAELDLQEVTRMYGTRGLPEGDPRTVGALEPWLPEFDTHAQEHIGHMLEIMTAELK